MAGTCFVYVSYQAELGGGANSLTIAKKQVFSILYVCIPLGIEICCNGGNF
jgi:hypothetical protein